GAQDEGRADAAGSHHEIVVGRESDRPSGAASTVMIDEGRILSPIDLEASAVGHRRGPGQVNAPAATESPTRTRSSVGLEQAIAGERRSADLQGSAGTAAGADDRTSAVGGESAGYGNRTCHIEVNRTPTGARVQIAAAIVAGRAREDRVGRAAIGRTGVGRS